MSFDVGELVVDDEATVLDTNISARQIRDLLNRPRGLNSATIVEYLNIRIPEVQKKSKKGRLCGRKLYKCTAYFTYRGRYQVLSLCRLPKSIN